jgi:hypothetical protein
MELKDVMNVLPVTIERFVSDDFPSCVECVLVDSEECSHRFVEKAPVVTTANLLLTALFLSQVISLAWLKTNGLISEGGNWSASAPPIHGVLNQQLGIRPSPLCANKLSMCDAVRVGSVPAIRAICDFQLDAGWALRR